MIKHFNDIPKFVTAAAYNVHHEWRGIERTLSNWNERIIANDEVRYDGLDLDPDFQRIHVWTPEQQTKYIEFILMDGYGGRNIYFNNPTWQGSYSEKTVLVDGKQRLQAVRLFLQDKVKAFNMVYSQFDGRLPMHCYFIFSMNTLKTRREVLEWYLAINTGGTPHTKEEIDRVKGLIKEIDKST